MIFECHEFRETDSNGEMTGIGITWTEARTLREKACDLIGRSLFAFALFVGAAACGTAVVGAHQISFHLIIAAFSLLGMAWIVAHTEVHMPGKRKWIVFWRDGQISSSDEGTWRTKVEELKSVEAEQLKQKKKDEDQPYTHGVRMITRRGRVLHLAKDVEPDDALTLAVMLSEAIEAVKYVDHRVVAKYANGHEQELVW
jgi:hypothetical protein